MCNNLRYWSGNVILIQFSSLTAPKWFKWQPPVVTDDCLNGTKPLPEPMLTNHGWVTWYLYESNLQGNTHAISVHDVQFSCAITQPLLAHHWRVHQCLLTSRFIAPLIPWGGNAPGGKMRKQLLKEHNFLNNSPIFIIESSTYNIFAFQKALHAIHFNLKNCFGFG